MRGSKVCDVDFDLSLSENLDRLGVSRQVDTELPHKRKWFANGAYIGSFDVGEAWVVLRHYNILRNWQAAKTHAQYEFTDGYWQR